MSAYTVLTDGTNEDEWYGERSGGVTATDIARLHSGGAGTWAAIRAEKAGKRTDFTFPAMQHGKDREPVIARYAQRAFGLAPSHAVLAAKDEPRFRATPDGLRHLGVARVGEYKTTVKDWQTLDDLPVRYFDQTTWQMRVTGYREAVLVYEPHEGGVPLYMEPKHFVIPYDESYAAELEALALEFLDGKSEPDPHAAELDALIELRLEAYAMKQAAEDRVDSIDAEIRALVQDKPTRFEGSYGNLTLGEVSTRRTVDSTRLKAEEPKTYEAFTKVSLVRGRLTVTERKAG